MRMKSNKIMGQDTEGPVGHCKDFVFNSNMR